MGVLTPTQNPLGSGYLNHKAPEANWKWSSNQPFLSTLSLQPDPSFPSSHLCSLTLFFCVQLSSFAVHFWKSEQMSWASLQVLDSLRPFPEAPGEHSFSCLFQHLWDLAKSFILPSTSWECYFTIANEEPHPNVNKPLRDHFSTLPLWSTPSLSHPSVIFSAGLFTTFAFPSPTLQAPCLCLCNLFPWPIPSTAHFYYFCNFPKLAFIV